MNPVLEGLGYSENDKVVIFHTDDIGMWQSTVRAYTDLLDFGLISSAATMIPCGWFPAVADICRQRDDVDMGVHLTITSEWDAYRWSPISTSDPTSGLIDNEGYFHRTTQTVQAQASAEVVETEIIAQIDRAKSAGIEPTHIDTHMGALFHAKFVPSYFQAALKYRIPNMIPRSSEAEMRLFGLDDAAIAAAQVLMQMMDEQRIAVFDSFHMMSLDEVWDDPVAQVTAALDSLPVGLNHFIIHPALDTPELRAVADDWQARVRDYEAFKSERLRDYVTNAGIKVIGYRKLRDWMRG
ncbi:MAG: polysaccharide deacetylase family protein [Anaerolineae bacterium]|nr:polysaccharide deacetylase family protein [Anaerolineae bacterium]MDQ7035425.1 polysaccharide deacetylase family protein [Anaerolineae bacterium]